MSEPVFARTMHRVSARVCTPSPASPSSLPSPGLSLRGAGGEIGCGGGVPRDAQAPAPAEHRGGGGSGPQDTAGRVPRRASGGRRHRERAQEAQGHAPQEPGSGGGEAGRAEDETHVCGRPSLPPHHHHHPRLGQTRGQERRVTNAGSGLHRESVPEVAWDARPIEGDSSLSGSTR